MIFREENYTCKNTLKEYFPRSRRLKKSETKVRTISFM